MINRVRPIAIAVTVEENSFTVHLKDGRTLRVPWRPYPNLLAATPQQKKAVRISAPGGGLHWDQLDEDISVRGLMRDAERRYLEERPKSVAVAVKVDINDL
ncbi:DUF2442 domain-containing protein [Paraburkholderia fungorum]|uniref:DUF2442 domain-containing protein n=1 Tax=Paraburkholderia fungorum TaxID=134537 RepID=UPI0038BC64A2